MAHLTCDQAEILLNLRLDGQLDGADWGRADLGRADAARLDAHLAACPACQAVWAELEALNTTLAALPDAPVPPVVLSGVLARVPGPAPAPAPANVRPWWRWLLGGGLALEAAIAALLLWLNWPLASSFAQGLVPTAVIDAAGRQVTDGIGAWASWLGAQAALVQAQWQAFSAQVSSLAPASPAPELVVQAIILLAAVLAVWVAGNRVLATISIQ